MELYVPDVSVRGIRRLTTDEDVVQEGYEAGGSMTLLTGQGINDHPILVEYEYTGRWYGTVVLCNDLAPWDLCESMPDEEAFTAVPISECVASTNEYVAGALDAIGSLRSGLSEILETKTLIWAGTVDAPYDDDGQLAVEEALIARAVEWAQNQ